MRKMPVYLYFCLVIFGCNDISLRNQDYVTLKYEELPSDVQDTIKTMSLKIYNVNYREDFFINLNENKQSFDLIFDEKIRNGFGGFSQPRLSFENRDFVFDFSNTEGRIPYVLKDNRLYFGTNLNIINFEQLLEDRFKMIDLNKYLR